MSKLKSTLLASIGAAAMLLAPLAVLPVSGLPAGYSAFAGNGKGNSAGNGGGDGDGNGGSASSESHGNSGQHETKAGKSEEAKAAKGEAKADKPRNLNAELGRLNSLNRNINGLMNSSDPHMAGIRDYVKANAALDAAEAALAQAQATLLTSATTFGGEAADALTSYDGFDYSTATPEELSTRLDDLQILATGGDLDAQAELDALAALDGFAAFDAAVTGVADAEAGVTEATDGTTDADLQAALEAAANKDGEITPAILAWAKAKLGVE